MPRHPTTAAHRLADREAGFSVVEVIVAIFVLGMLSIGVLPLMVTALNASTTNRQIVNATGFADDQLATMRQRVGVAPTSTCAQISAIATELTVTRDDLKAVVTTAGCPEGTSRPGTVTVSARVTPTNSTRVLAELSTQILVS